MTLVEVLVVIGILGALLALLLPAAMRVRQTAARLSSMNNMRQIILATHNFGTTYDGDLPSMDGNPRSVNPYSPILCAILPFLEQDGSYAQLQETGRLPSLIVRLYLSPPDPTVSTVVDPVSSYAANAVVFQGRPRMPGNFTDGTSNTIAFAEHYAQKCGGDVSFWIVTTSGFLVSHRATFADRNMGDVYPITSGRPPR